MRLGVGLDVKRLAGATNTLQAKRPPLTHRTPNLQDLYSNAGRLPSPLLRTAHV